MEGAVMVGRGPTGAGVLVLSILVIILTAEGCRAQKDGCGPTVLGPSSGTLSSLGYPGPYPNNTVCEWEISVPPGNRVRFRFAELDIDDSDCQVNYLRLYNGIGPTRNEIKYCGLNVNVNMLIESTGNQVTVQFMSGSHHTGRGFYLSYSTTEHTLITCLHKGSDFPEAEFKYCPAGCLTSTQEVSGTIPNGYRESSPLCLAAVHAGVVSNAIGGRIHVVSSKGIPHYKGTLANNVTCYGTLGLESGSVADIQISASSVWEWNDVAGQLSVWAPSGARLKKAGLPWAPSQNDQHQWLQVDLKRQKRITITSTGSTLREYPYYVAAYRVLYSHDGQRWLCYKEANSTQDMVFQGNINYLDEVRNNFIPPIEARYVRINPTWWQQRIAIKLELLGCQVSTTKRPRTFGKTTPSPDIRNTTMPEVALAAVLVPVLVMVLTALILLVVCAWHWRSKQSSEGAYDLPHWNRTWWKSMKQLLPSKMVDAEVRYSSSEVGRLTTRGAVPRLYAEPAYAQPLVSGVTTLGARSTFKPDEGSDPGYSDPDLYDAPISPDVYHAYAEPLPASGTEYATPIVVDMGCHPSGAAPTALLLARTDGSQSAYDTPKTATGHDPTYQV
uniref:Discoidin, CUB and LCCL domain containing 2 n=1 Tax=Hippocampus comes TaxID=109280 RepID=A0A3Q2YK19_HIPCM